MPHPTRPPVAAPCRRPIDHAGFSLIELLIVIVIIGLVTAISIPRIDVDAYRITGTVRSLNSSLMYAERLAITLQHDVRVSIDVLNNRMRIHEDNNNDGNMDAGERITYVNLGENVTFGVGGALPLPFGAATVNLTQASTDGLPMIVFRRDGTASENGGFYIIPIRSLALGLWKNVRAGEVVRSTGRILWYSYSTNTWQRGN